jgi:hypothetical protein
MKRKAVRFEVYLKYGPARGARSQSIKPSVGKVAERGSRANMNTLGGKYYALWSYCLLQTT